MKSITHFIREAIETYRLNFVEVTYIVKPEEIILQAPETFQESDIQQYMDDMWLNALPSSQDYSESFFGKNYDSISDAHFEYDIFEHVTDEPVNYIEWQSKYDVKQTSSDVKLDYFKIKRLRYIITFDRFDMTDGVNDSNVRKYLIDVFKATESNDMNKYPIQIKFYDDNLEYRK